MDVFQGGRGVFGFRPYSAAGSVVQTSSADLGWIYRLLSLSDVLMCHIHQGPSIAQCFQIFTDSQRNHILFPRQRTTRPSKNNSIKMKLLKSLLSFLILCCEVPFLVATSFPKIAINVSNDNPRYKCKNSFARGGCSTRGGSAVAVKTMSAGKMKLFK